MTKKTQSPRRIGLLGCAIPTLALAPFDDLSWELWASGQLQPDLKRFDCWWELHDVAGLPPPFAQHITNLQKATYPVYGLNPSPLLPNLICIDRATMIARYGTEFLTSTAATMFAFAIHLDPPPEEIGLWGIEMCSEGEYFFQRAGCKFFQWVAEQKGIKVTIPPESELSRENPAYPEGEELPFARWVTLRSGLTDANLVALREKEQTIRDSINHFEGAKEVFDHIRRGHRI